MSADECDAKLVAEGVEAIVKWFDPRRCYGFCSVTGNLQDKVPEVFFGEQEAKAGRLRGLTLSRGERLECDIVEGCERRSDNALSKRRFSAAVLRPCQSGSGPPGSDADGDTLRMRE
ncbi:unnamed protein product, partial [Cladocopium goreaui]